MALYALGDLHLSFQADKAMDVFGRVWRHHERKIEKYVNKIVKPEDTLVLTITPGEENWKNAGKILRSSRTFRGERSCSGEIMTCSGTRKKQNS